jgi:putative ABC transport system permease protein
MEGTGLDDQRQVLNVVGSASVLPRVLDNGVLVDLADMTASSDPTQSKASDEVWLTPGPHPDIEHALTAAGVTILGRDTLTMERTTLADAGPSRAVLVNFALAALSILLMLTVLAATQVIDAARRRQLWTVADLSGVRRRRMTWLVVAEIAAPAIAGVCLGVASGLLAIWLAGDRLPLFAEGTVAPPLDTAVAWELALVIAAVALAGVVLAAAISATAEARAARTPP